MTPCPCHPGTTCTSAASCAAARRVEFGETVTTTTAMPELPEPKWYSFGAHKEEDQPLFTADQMRAYALATLQAQPAEVSDAEINRIACKAGFSAVDVEVNGRAFARFARAILALRPQASPKSALMAVHRDYIDGYRAGVEDGQRLGQQAVPMTDWALDVDSIGITAPAGGEKQA